MSAAIVGLHEHPQRVAPDYTPLRFIGESAGAALADAGLEREDIDGLCCAGDAMDVNFVTEYLGLRPSWVDSTSSGGSSFLSHIFHAATAIDAGLVRAVLVVYGSIARSAAAAFGSSGGAQRTSDPMAVDGIEAFTMAYGIPLAANYALVANQHMHHHGTTHEQLAEIAVAMRSNAARNPKALYRDAITVEDVVSSRPIATPLHLLDCCVITDGGGAVIVASEEVARRARAAPVWVLGGAESLAHGGNGGRELLDIAALRSGPQAFERAGTTPDDVDLCMIYDSFTITVLTTLEALGFCEVGAGGRFVEGDALTIDGRLPVNPDGGALSSNHPGRRGLFLAIEAARQLRGEATDRQVDEAEVAVCHGTGGFLAGRHSAVTLLLGTTP